jgi:hypothetical protein
VRVPKPILSRVVGRELLRQDLDRHLSPEPRVLGEVDDTHPAAAELALHAIGAECLPRERSFLLRSVDQSARQRRRCFEEDTRLLMRCQQRLDFAAKSGVAAAFAVEVGGTLRRVALQRGAQEIGDSRPAMIHAGFRPWRDAGRRG